MNYKKVRKACRTATFSLSAALVMTVPAHAETELVPPAAEENFAEENTAEGSDETSVETLETKSPQTELVIPDGWMKINGKWFFYQNGAPLRDCWVNSKEKWYYLNEDGSMKSNEVFYYKGNWYGVDTSGSMFSSTTFTLNGKTYKANSWGGLYTGFVTEEDGLHYYSVEDASEQIGWIQSNGSRYYLSEAHTLLEGFQLLNGTWYYFQEDCTLLSSQWLKYKGSWYYFREDGSMYANEFFFYSGSYYYARSWGGIYTDTKFTVDGKTYWAKSWGGLYTGSVVIDGIDYEFSETGVMVDITNSWIKKNDNWYFIKENGTRAVSEWIKYKDAWYYCDENGIMLKNTFFEVNGNLYYAQSWGAIYTGTQFTVDGKTYWAQSWGGLYTGNKVIDGIEYHFDSKGVLLGAKAGWFKKGSQYFYCREDGQLVKNDWLKLDGSWYFFNEDGSMKANEFFSYKGSIYYVTENGSMKANTKFVADGKTYWAKSWGGLYTGTVTLDGIEYHFNESGVLMKVTPHWEQKGSDWYYMKEDGSYAASEWLKYNSVWYYLGENGVMKANEFFRDKGNLYYARGFGGIYTDTKFKINGKTYWAQNWGGIYTGWFRPDNKTYYYADENGAMYISSFLQYSGNRYYLDSNGAMVTGWQTINGASYYFQSWGGAYTGTHTINGTSYTFASDGKLQSSNTPSPGTGGTTSDCFKVTNARSGVKSIKNLLLNALTPVGRCLYIYGGGHDKDASRIGMNPQWENYFNANDSTYDYDKHRYEYGNGLDCSGFVGWAAYQCTLSTCVNYSYAMPTDFASYGWGTVTENYSGKFLPGDVVATSGHVWIVLGSCNDGSVVVLHATPQYVQISGTCTPSGSYGSEAVSLANSYMRRYYKTAFNRYGNSSGSLRYLNNTNRFTWKSSYMSDSEGFRNKSAAEILRILFNE